MSEALQAAWITGLLQGAPALFTALIAFIALKAWRPNTLGQRKIELAEECLKLIWQLDREIYNARMPMFTGVGIPPPQENEKTSFQEVRSLALIKIKEQFRKCISLQKSIDVSLQLLEFYQHKTLPFVGSSKDGIELPIVYEYGLIIGLLSQECDMAFSNPEYDECGNCTNLDIRRKAYQAYSGSSNTEHFEDEYTIRLRVARVAVERNMRTILQQRGFITRLVHHIGDRFMDWRDRKKRQTKITN